MAELSYVTDAADILSAITNYNSYFYN